MATILELRTARMEPGAPGQALAAGAELAAARLLTELEIAKARLDKSFSELRGQDPLAAEIYALRRAVHSLDGLLRARGPSGERASPHGQRTVGGSEERIEATLPPVFSPKMVPRS
jgi:hypothetical protein